MVHGRRMAAPDAQLLWLSAKAPNDQFLLFVFDGKPNRTAVEDIRRRAEAIPELCLRVHDDGPWRYPRWVSGSVRPEQFVVHPGSAGEWQDSLEQDRLEQDCLESVAKLLADQLEVSEMAWRVHILPSARHCVVVVQIAHALGDGTRSAALAAALLGRAAPIPAVAQPKPGSLLWRSVAAAREHRRLVADTDAGLLPPPGTPRSALSVNNRQGGRSVLRRSVLRVLTVERDTIASTTVTVGALVAISEALGGYLSDRGEDVTNLLAEVPMAYNFGLPLPAHNNFRNGSVGLHSRVPPAERAARIAAELSDQRKRTQHPATRASVAAFAAMPAPLLRWGVRQFDPSARSVTVSGHTVVSSVNRGPADLSFGGCPVRLTAGFPALSSNMGLTHGVHGIGETVAVSVHADPAVVDVDDYVERLACALRHSY